MYYILCYNLFTDFCTIVPNISMEQSEGVCALTHVLCRVPFWYLYSALHLHELIKNG